MENGMLGDREVSPTVSLILIDARTGNRTHAPAPRDPARLLQRTSSGKSGRGAEPRAQEITGQALTQTIVLRRRRLFRNDGLHHAAL
jgi:hypothetical protein